ncbi:MAG TPA: SDR family oxidoreductase [Stellaceae bacterium]|jgi:3-oxoacyl-[acyl-carrier protein] reductase|nr:SDR family oxidoreductase [Stellaceae bacterium]
MDLGITGKRALVLGAGGGLGGAIAKALAEEGAHVIGTSRKPPETASPPAASWHALDLFDKSTIDRLADALLAEGGVDILVNNSGGPPPSEAQSSSFENWTSQFAAMGAGLFHLTNRLLPKMIERRWGRIITVASSGVQQPIPRLALSNGIRAAVQGWSKTLAAEVAAHGVTVNLILPGRIETARVMQIDTDAAKRQNASLESIQDAQKSGIPAGRYGTPEEFGKVAAFLASQHASYVTGTSIRVDGGLIRSV